MKNVKLGTLGDIFIGLTYRPDDVSANGTVVLRSSNIQEGQLDFADTIRVNCKIRENLFVKENDILMCSRNGSAKLVGKCTLIPKLNEDMTFGAFMTIIRTSHNAYLQHFFNSTAFRTQIKGSATTTINQITRKMLDDIDVPIFDTNEEKHIVETFDKLTRLIALRTEQLKKLDELVKSRFIELFGDPFNNKKWDTQKLRNISVSISDGSNVDKTYYEDKGDVLFLRIQNVWFNEFRLDDSVYISEDVNNEYLDTSLHHGDLLITKIGRYYTKDSSLGRVSVYLGEDDKANYSNNIMRVRLTDEVCSEFVNILMNLDDYNRYIREVSVGGTDKRALSKAIIGDLPIIMPPKELQFEFLEFVRQTDKSKLAVQQSLEKLEILKKALMQKYFG